MDKQKFDEYLPDAYGEIREGTHYFHIDWYAEDPEPAYPNFETSEFGSVPKSVMVIKGTHLVRTDFSLLSKS